MIDSRNLRKEIEIIVDSTPVIDIHTHLVPPEFGSLCLWGIDELLRYHYLVAELLRYTSMPPENYWSLPPDRQADLIWDTLFVRNTPLSEAARGVVAVMTALGLDPAAKDLREARSYLSGVDVNQHVSHVLALANVSELVMTNDPLDEAEARLWRQGALSDKRFRAALRMDPILNDWINTAPRLAAQGFHVTEDLSDETVKEARRFLDEWIDRMQPLYMAVSLPFTFSYPDASPRTALLREVVIPTAKARGLPLATMIGVARRINPALREAGDGVGRADLTALERLCREHPDVRFLATVLSRENQHEFCVIARKFYNLVPFGCWWFMNNPSIVMEITSERIEMLGSSFIPQHSDARVLEQIIYKWRHSRRVIAAALYDSYSALALDGWHLTPEHIRRDVSRMFSGVFESITSGGQLLGRNAIGGRE
jgi:hypothetical protein